VTEFQLEDYVVRLDRGLLSICHALNPNVPLLSHSSSLLEAAQTELEISDRRSIYTITPHSSAHYREAVLSRLDLEGSETLVLYGYFADGPEVTFRIEFQLREGALGFNVRTSDPRINHLVLCLDSPPDEQIFGLGEQYSFLDLKGQTVPILSQEQGLGRGDPVVTPRINRLSPGVSGTPVTSYTAFPHWVGSAPRSLFLENTEYAVFDFADPLKIRMAVFSATLTARLPAADSLLGHITAFTRYSGRMKLLPEWLDRGAIVGLQGGTRVVREHVAALLAAGTPIAAIWLQDWVGKRSTLGGAASQLWWNWELDEQHYPDWPALRAELAAQGIRVLAYVNPFLVDVATRKGVRRNLYAEARANGYLVRQADGTAYQITNTDFSAGLVDLLNPAAREWLKACIHDNLLGNGFSGWMADFGESLPFDITLANGESGAEWHNRYPVEWARLNAEVVAEAGRKDDVAYFMRAAGTQSPGLASLFWAGDQNTTWDHFDGLQSALIGILNGGFSGMSLNHSDCGGYTSLNLWPLFSLRRSEELLLRWAEVNAFTAVLRTHEGLAPKANVQVYTNARTRAHFAHCAQVYAALAAYRRGLFREAAEHGWPVLRHPLQHFPDDPWFARMLPDTLEFMLGADIIVAPVLTPGATCRCVHLPQGRWFNAWNGRQEDVGPAGKTFEEAAPPGYPPAFLSEAFVLAHGKPTMALPAFGQT